jgi:hypothetical protein
MINSQFSHYFLIAVTKKKTCSKNIQKYNKEKNYKKKFSLPVDIILTLKYFYNLLRHPMPFFKELKEFY